MTLIYRGPIRILETQCYRVEKKFFFGHFLKRLNPVYEKNSQINLKGNGRFVKLSSVWDQITLQPGLWIGRLGEFQFGVPTLNPNPNPNPNPKT